MFGVEDGLGGPLEGAADGTFEGAFALLGRAPAMAPLPEVTTAHLVTHGRNWQALVIALQLGHSLYRDGPRLAAVGGLGLDALCCWGG